MSVWIRKLAVAEVLERVKERWGEDVARHNAALMEPLERVPSLRVQVLQEFAEARRRGR